MRDLIDDKHLEEIEAFAIKLTRQAGLILLKNFGRPLCIEYKSEDESNPVTDVDKQSEEYLKEAILCRYPSHAILAEEGSQIDSNDSDFVWVLDPLDGTVNFLNGLPVFGVSVGVLYKGYPVVGCIFIPSPTNSEGSVFHARRNGGAFCDDDPISVSQDARPKRSRITIFPGSFTRSVRLSKDFRGQMGELRSPGSVAYELALTASGVIQFSVFNRPWIWDVAAGIVLVTESRGVSLIHGQERKVWQQFESFKSRSGDGLSLAQLKEWRTPWLFGNPVMVEYVADQMSPRTRINQIISRWVSPWL